MTGWTVARGNLLHAVPLDSQLHGETTVCGLRLSGSRTIWLTKSLAIEEGKHRGNCRMCLAALIPKEIDHE